MTQLGRRGIVAAAMALGAPAVRAASAPIRIGALTEMGGPLGRNFCLR